MGVWAVNDGSRWVLRNGNDYLSAYPVYAVDEFNCNCSGDTVTFSPKDGQGGTDVYRLDESNRTLEFVTTCHS